MVLVVLEYVELYIIMIVIYAPVLWLKEAIYFSEISRKLVIFTFCLTFPEKKLQ